MLSWINKGLKVYNKSKKKNTVSWTEKYNIFVIITLLHRHIVIVVEAWTSLKDNPLQEEEDIITTTVNIKTVKYFKGTWESKMKIFNEDHLIKGMNLNE